MTKQLILTADKQIDGSIIRTLIEIEQTEDSYTRFPWNAQSIDQIVLNLLVDAIAKRLGVESQPIDLIEIGEEIAKQEGVEFRKIKEIESENT